MSPPALSQRAREQNVTPRPLGEGTGEQNVTPRPLGEGTGVRVILGCFKSWNGLIARQFAP